MIELPPDPVRMVEGLRDTGYDFDTAVADVVDNSIAADATFIEIQLNMDFKGNITLSIYDDGIGMNRDGLINAMRYGSKPRQSAASLGKFGLGLKTASTAFSRKLVVISRDTASSPLLSATWDLDHIREKQSWQLVVDPPSLDQSADFERVVGPRSGTLVVWEKADRVLRTYKNAGGAVSKKALKAVEEGLRKHLSTVYQRFLDAKDSRARHLRMSLNNQEILPWDPFCIDESQLVIEESTDVELPGGDRASFLMKAYVLPRKEEFATEASAKRAAISNQNQGIYVYRENRLIHGPDWLGMFSKEPHLSLLRVEFSFDHKLDEAFQIDIKKSQILLDEALAERVSQFLTAPRRHADEVSRKGTKAKAAAAGKSAHDSSNRNISIKQDGVNQPAVKAVVGTTNEAEIHNKLGTVRLKLKISTASKPSEVHIQPVDSIDDGLLWEPCLIDGRIGVRINTGHSYYHKVYLPNITEGVTIQGMDALIWGLSVAELNCTSEATKNTFSELRYEVSRTLRKLVEDMPDAKVTE